MSAASKHEETFFFIRRIAKMGEVYIIVVPKVIGKRLHGKHVQVAVKPIEEVGEGGQ